MQFPNPVKSDGLQRQDLGRALVAWNNLVPNLLGEGFILGEDGTDRFEMLVQAGSETRGGGRVKVINQLIKMLAETRHSG